MAFTKPQIRDLLVFLDSLGLDKQDVQDINSRRIAEFQRLFNSGLPGTISQDFIDALNAANPPLNASNAVLGEQSVDYLQTKQDLTDLTNEVADIDTRIFNAIYDDYDDLIANQTSPTTGEIFPVLNEQGKKPSTFTTISEWFSRVTGGSPTDPYYPAGVYVYTGTEFRPLDDGFAEFFNSLKESIELINNPRNTYEVYEAGSTPITDTFTIINFETEREASPSFSLSGGRITINEAIRELTVEYSVSPDRLINNRATCEHQVHSQLGGAPTATPYPGSISYSYHRTLASGEGTGSKKVTFNNLVVGDIIDLRSRIISGTVGSMETKAEGSNLIVEIKAR